MKKYSQSDIDSYPRFSKYDFIWEMMPGDEIVIECDKEQIRKIRAAINMTIPRHNPNAKFITRKANNNEYWIIRVK